MSHDLLNGFLTHVIAQLNAAKGRLRTIFYRALEQPLEKLLEAHCKCKGDSLWGYEKALFDTHVWPAESFTKNTSMDVLLKRLEDFKYKPAAGACMTSCHQDYEFIVRGALKFTATYFQGMCLDCMDRLKPKLRDGHEDYWHHNNFSAERSPSCFVGCRIKHRQPSWYYSFMGRQEHRDHLQENSREKSRRHYDSDSDFE